MDFSTNGAAVSGGRVWATLSTRVRNPDQESDRTSQRTLWNHRRKQGPCGFVIWRCLTLKRRIAGLPTENKAAP